MDHLTTLSDRDLAKPVQVLIVDQALPVFGINSDDSPLLDTGDWEGGFAGGHRRSEQFRRALRKGDRGMHKIAAEFGVGTGTVQRIKAEMEEPR